MHDLGAGLNSERWTVFKPRSSVASKRFPLSNVRSARFSLCAGFFVQASPAGRGSLKKNLRIRRFGCPRER